MSTMSKPLGLSSVVTDETGRRLRDRRIRMGISVRQLADAAGVDRGRLAKLEAGDGHVRETTVGKVDAALTRLEHEMGMEDSDADPEAGIVEFRVTGNFGVDVVVKGPVRDLAALEDSVGRILSRMQREQRELPPNP